MNTIWQNDTPRVDENIEHLGAILPRALARLGVTPAEPVEAPVKEELPELRVVITVLRHRTRREREAMLC